MHHTSKIAEELLDEVESREPQMLDETVWENRSLEFILNYIKSDFSHQEDKKRKVWLGRVEQYLYNNEVLERHELHRIDPYSTLRTPWVSAFGLEEEGILEFPPEEESYLHTLQDRTDLSIAVIGVFLGAYTSKLLELLDVETAYLIDPYEQYAEYDMSAKELSKALNGPEQQFETFSEVKEAAHDMLDEYSDQLVWIEEPSSSAISEIQEPLDLAYIDGNHRYEYVKQDMELYWDSIDPTGILAGHDIQIPQVAEAVADFCQEEEVMVAMNPDFEVHRTEDWWIAADTDSSDLTWIETVS